MKERGKALRRFPFFRGGFLGNDPISSDGTEMPPTSNLHSDKELNRGLDAAEIFVSNFTSFLKTEGENIPARIFATPAERAVLSRFQESRKRKTMRRTQVQTITGDESSETYLQIHYDPPPVFHTASAEFILRFTQQTHSPIDFSLYGRNEFQDVLLKFLIFPNLVKNSEEITKKIEQARGQVVDAVAIKDYGVNFFVAHHTPVASFEDWYKQVVS